MVYNVMCLRESLNLLTSVADEGEITDTCNLSPCGVLIESVGNDEISLKACESTEKAKFSNDACGLLFNWLPLESASLPVCNSRVALL